MKFELLLESPYDLARCVWVFNQYPLDGADVWCPANGGFPAQYRRLYVIHDEPVLAIVQQEGKSRLIVRTHPAQPKHLSSLKSQVSWQFHLDAPLESFYSLAEKHPFFRSILKTLYGVKPLRTPTLYEMAVIAITEQQLAYPVAVKMRGGLVESFGQRMTFEEKEYRAFPTAQAIAACQIKDLQALSFSTRKAEYLVEISRKVAREEMNLETLRDRTNEEIIAALTSLRGFGRWSADYFLTRGMGRSDIFPADDLGVQNLVGKHLGSGRRATAEECRQILQKWGAYKRWAIFYLLSASRLKII